MKTRLRITIEGQGGGASNQLANVIAGIVQLSGYPTVHITDTVTGYSSERGGLEVDAQIVVQSLPAPKPDPLSQALNEGDGVYRP